MKVEVKNIDVAERLLEKIRNYQDNIPLALIKSSDLVVEKIKNRIQNNGQATNGSILFTRSREKLGAYSKQHGSARVWDGLQISKVDLTYTGALMKSFDRLTNDQDSSTIGFDSSAESEKAVKMEKLYQTPIFNSSDQEKQFAVNEFKKEVFK